MTGSRGKWFGFALIFVGAVFLLDSTGTYDLGEILRTFWPLFLVFWGIAVITRTRFGRRRDSAPAVTATVTGSGSAAESLESSNVFGDVDIRVTSPSFRGGSATTVFGDIMVDCRQGGLADGEHTLSVSGVFGDSRLLVPPGIALDITAHTLAGDVTLFDQKRSGVAASLRFTTPGYDAAPKRLRINVSQVFGDVDAR